MEKGLRNLLLIGGAIWTGVWVILFLSSSWSVWPSILYEIPGLLLIFFSLYGRESKEEIIVGQKAMLEDLKSDGFEMYP